MVLMVIPVPTSTEETADMYIMDKTAVWRWYNVKDVAYTEKPESMHIYILLSESEKQSVAPRISRRRRAGVFVDHIRD